MPAANRTSLIHEATRQALWVNDNTGRELRLARIAAGKTQQQVSVVLSCSKSEVSRREHGLVRTLSVVEVSRHAAAVGLRCSVRFYPAVRRPLDAPQLALLARLRQRVAAEWRWEVEVPVPRPGDLRAADALLSTPSCRIVVEAITRLADVQAQLRAAHLKTRDLAADRTILLVSATVANRRMIRAAGPMLDEALPLRTWDGLRALSRGLDPGADALIVL